jgi:hypothetical protein
VSPRPPRAAALLAVAALVVAAAVAVPGAAAATSSVPGPDGGDAVRSAQTDPNEANVSVDATGGNVTVAAGPSQRIAGTAEVRAGTRVSVRVRSVGDTSPAFIKVREAVVREDGTWGVAMNFSEQSVGSTFDVTAVLADSDVRASATGTVVACEGNCSDGAPAPTPTPVPTETPADADGDGADRTPVAPPDVSVDREGGTLTVAAGPGQLVTGTSDAAAGTALSVRLTSAGDTRPQFLKTARAVVRDDGTWGTTFNFSRQSAGDTFELDVVVPTAAGVDVDGRVVTQVDGRVVACEGDCSDGAPRATPTPSPTPTAAPAADGDAGFETSIPTVSRGRTAALAVRFGDADALTVVLGGQEAGYELVATVRDGNGDGRTTLYVDTAAAGRDGATATVAEGDRVTVRSEVALDARLDADEYDVALHRGESRDGPRVDVGTLVVRPSGTATPTGSGSEADANAPDETPAEVTTRDPARAGDDALGAVPDWLAAAGAGLVFLLGGAGLAVVLLRDGE